MGKAKFLVAKIENFSGNIVSLLNTSLNLGGEPIVNNPQQASETLAFSEMDFLCIGRYLVWR